MCKQINYPVNKLLRVQENKSNNSREKGGR